MSLFLVKLVDGPEEDDDAPARCALDVHEIRIRRLQAISDSCYCFQFELSKNINFIMDFLSKNGPVSCDLTVLLHIHYVPLRRPG